jgi:hypothetical protein
LTFLDGLLIRGNLPSKFWVLQRYHWSSHRDEVEYGFFLDRCVRRDGFHGETYFSFQSIVEYRSCGISVSMRRWVTKSNAVQSTAAR